MIVSSEYDTHLEQIKVENREDVDAVQWWVQVLQKLYLKALYNVNSIMFSLVYIYCVGFPSRQSKPACIPKKAMSMPLVWSHGRWCQLSDRKELFMTRTKSGSWRVSPLTTNNLKMLEANLTLTRRLTYKDRFDEYWHKLAVRNEELANVNQNQLNLSLHAVYLLIYAHLGIVFSVDKEKTKFSPKSVW